MRINLLQAYAAKYGMPNAGKPKVFLRYFYVNPATGEKSGEHLIQAFYSATEPILYRLMWAIRILPWVRLTTFAIWSILRAAA